MVQSPSVVLCADDFGLTDGVSRGIAALAEAGRLSATGAMTNMPGWARNAPLLEPLKGRIAIGLHLNLTTGRSLGAIPNLAPGGAFPPLKELLAKALSRRIAPEEVRAEIARQLDAFEDVHGARPDFVDGHQHVHVLPVVRQALIREMAARDYAGQVWLRDPSERAGAVMGRPVGRGKALIVGALAVGFRGSAHAAEFSTNEGFSGFAPFDLSVSPARIFASAFSHLGRKPLVMCHPGHVDDELRGLDPAVESRPAELDYLMSDAFRDLLDERGITLSPTLA